MEITDIKIFKIKQRGALLGYANVIFRGIKIVEKERRGRFVAMPSRRLMQEKRAYRDLCHPLNQETRELLTKEIFEAYDALEETEE